MKSVAGILKKVKKFADEWVDNINLILPIGWVLACYDGATEYLLSGEYIRFFDHLVASCIVSGLLLGFGFLLSGLDLKPYESDPSQVGRWKTLGIELLILFWITFYLASK